MRLPAPERTKRVHHDVAAARAARPRAAGGSTAAGRWPATPDSRMSSGFCGNRITTRGVRPPLRATEQQRRLVEVHGQVRLIVSVRDRASLVGEHAPQHGAVLLVRRHVLGGDPRRDPVHGKERRRRSFGQQRAALPDELRELLQPFGAHAAADVVARVQRRSGWASRRSVCTAAARCRSRARPSTWLAAVPPTLGNTITSYFARRFPSRSF